MSKCGIICKTIGEQVSLLKTIEKVPILSGNFNTHFKYCPKKIRIRKLKFDNSEIQRVNMHFYSNQV